MIVKSSRKYVSSSGLNSHLELDWPCVDVLDEPGLCLEPGDERLDAGQLLRVVGPLEVDQPPLTLRREVGLVRLVPVVH